MYNKEKCYPMSNFICIVALWDPLGHTFDQMQALLNFHLSTFWDHAQFILIKPLSTIELNHKELYG